MKAPGYEFTIDWLAAHVPTWDGLIEKYRPSRILEIGCYEGRATSYLIESCSRHKPIAITCTDTWTGNTSNEYERHHMAAVEARFDGNVSAAKELAINSVMVTKTRGASTKVLAEMVGRATHTEFDLIYVDGSHKAKDVLADAV